MKYLTMIVALSPGVVAFSGVQSKLCLNSASVGYSDASSSTDSTCGPCRNRHVSKTHLNYISGANHEHTDAHNHSKESTSTWWDSIFGREQKSAADDYLEYLDRRYNRILHDDEEQTESKGFSVMNWLYQGNNREIEASAQNQHEEDALYVLGVANLASKKFLQKKHLPAPEEVKTFTSSKPQASVDVEIVEETPVPVSVIVTLFHQAALRREVFVQKQSQTLGMVLACVVRSVATSPQRASQALRKLFDMGGGKKTMAMTFAALAALSILLRPILKVAAAEGANTWRP